VPRHVSRRSWLHRIRPAAVHEPFDRIGHDGVAAAFDSQLGSPNQLRWNPLPIPSAPTDFVSGLVTAGATGTPAAQSGCAIHWYVGNCSMRNRFFCNADGEMLIVPQLGRLRVATELGILEIGPLEIAVLPRGLRFRVELMESEARGYVCENFGAALRLLNLGPIGSNGLARSYACSGL
jgi:homogentisate 1,2-dioxygenase